MCSSSVVLFIPFILLSSCMMTYAGSPNLPNFAGSASVTIEDEFDSQHDETHAFDIKSEDKQEPHEALYKEVEEVISELPAENSYVKKALRDAAKKLHNADDALEEQELKNLPDELAAPASGAGGGRPSWCLRKLFGLPCRERPRDQVHQQTVSRLRGAAKASGDVLDQTREATERGFDVLKYDVYQGGAPKTPERAKNIAQRIVDAAKEDREKFLHPIVTSVGGITSDARKQEQNPTEASDRAAESGASQEKGARGTVGIGFFHFAGLAAVPQMILMAVLLIELPRSMGIVDWNAQDLIKCYRAFLSSCTPEAIGLAIVFVVAVFLRFEGEVRIPNDPLDIEVWEELKAEWPVLMGGDTLLNLQSMLRLLIFMSVALRAGLLQHFKATGIVTVRDPPLSGMAAALSLAAMLTRARLCTQAPVFRPEGPLSLGGQLPYFCDVCSVPLLVFVSLGALRPSSGSPWRIAAAVAFAMCIASRNYLNLADGNIDYLYTLAHVLELFAALAFLWRATITSVSETDNRKHGCAHGCVLVSFVYVLMAFQQALAGYYFFTHFEYAANLVGAGRPFGTIIWSNVLASAAYLVAAALYLSGLHAESAETLPRKTSRVLH